MATFSDDDPFVPRPGPVPRRQGGGPTTLGGRFSQDLVMAAERHKGNLAFGLLRRLAVIVRGGLTCPELSDSADEGQRGGGGGGRRDRPGRTSNPDGPQGARNQSRLWERARLCVGRVSSTQDAYTFLAKAEGQGETWYQAVASLLALKYSDCTFRNASGGVDDDPQETSCLLSCGPASIRHVFIDICQRHSLTPAQLGSELRWSLALPDEPDPGAFKCLIHGDE